jgi:hypothetical protein
LEDEIPYSVDFDQFVQSSTWGLYCFDFVLFFSAMRLVLLCFVGLLLSVDCLIPPEQKDALITLYNATGGPFWLEKWDLLEDPCELWSGVVCDFSSGKVLQLALNYNNLTGSLPDELQLPDLTFL